MKDPIAQIENWLAVENKKQWELAQLLNAPAATINRWIRNKVKISNAYMNILKSKKIIRE